MSLRWLLVVAVTLVAVASASADTNDPRTRPSKADQRRAAASVLAVHDLGPAWKGGAVAASSLKIPVCPGNILDNSDLTLTGHAESVLQLESEGLLVDTDVEVFASATQVGHLFARMVSPLLTSCLKYDLAKSIGSTGAKIGAVTPVALKQVGARLSNYRVALTYQGKAIVSDYLFVASGRSQFFVNIVAPASLKSELTALESRIAKLLATRGAR